MKKLLLLILVLSTSSILFGQKTLFFSEYIDGSGNNKALEIYNPTDNTVDLSDYYVVRFSNGEKYPTSGSALTTSGGYLHLQGMLAAGECWVIVNGQTETNEFSPACSPELQALADQLDGNYPAPTYMNGNDAIALLKSTDGENFTPIDLLGEIGLLSVMEDATGWSNIKDTAVTYNSGEGVMVTSTITDYVVKGSDDTGTANYGPYWMAWTKDHTLIRNPDVSSGITNNPHPFNVTAEWDTIPSVWQGDSMWVHVDIWTNLGTHTYTGSSNGFFDTKIIDQKVSISPNPVINNHFEIRSNDNKINSVEIFNIIGQTIFRKSDELSNTYLINLNTPEKGIYLVKINFENNNSLVKKIVIK